jgi:hypothetical protein
VPTSLGLLIMPAAHPSNSQRVDLVVAPLALCQQMTSAAACAAAVSVVGTDGITRYGVGTTTALNFEHAESLTCASS